MSASRQGAVIPDRAGAAKEELFFLAVRGLAEGESLTSATDRRFADLAAHLALADAAWSCRLIGWLAAREPLGSAAIVAAVEWVRAGLRAGLTASGGNRQLISGILRSADQPGELLGYWFRRYGHPVPKPIKRGVADAALVLYDERAVAVHDRPGGEVRFADVIKMTHPRPAAGVQSDLFHHLLASHGGSPHEVPVSLPRLHARAALHRLSREERRDILRRADASDILVQAAMTADMIPGWLGEPLDARAWRAVLPLMGYRDRLRALRDFDEAGLDDQTAGEVAAMLADADQVALAGVRPLEILAAGEATPARRWGRALERAAEAALAAVPVLPGRTLILLDHPAPMFTEATGNTAQTVAGRAATFARALALRAEQADLVQFGGTHARVPLQSGAGLRTVTERFREMADGDAAAAVRDCFDRHDRVVIVTGEPRGSARGQDDPVAALPAGVPSYIWDAAGAMRMPSLPGRYVFRGLTDAAFEVIPLIESARVSWPF
ncbi:TROVE domain-containing protein [Actinomadura formosensis]|uniref:TROVE domain-containing protein n=1 Tax=Actinomadura formosensis TaxID=60706 RepID=UPI003D8C46AC